MVGTRIALALLALLLLAVAGDASAQTTVPKGFSLFQTDPTDNVFKFIGKHQIPAGFFGPGSEAFEGAVNFGGEPLVKFQGVDVGNADTVVERTADAAPGGDGAPGAEPAPGEPSPIELRALSLVAVSPIAVVTGRTTQLWDVRADLSPSRPSTGSFRLTQTASNGGTLDSQLTVYPVFTFTRLSDGERRVLDVGALPDGQRPDDPVVGRATPWRAGCVVPALEIANLNPGFCAGQRPGGGTTVTIQQSEGLQHGIRPASARLEHFGCYSAPSGKGFRRRKVTLSDQFDRRVARVTRGLTLCAPTRKNKEAAVFNTRDHLRCYATNRGRSVAQTVLLRNQFGPFRADVFEPNSLCVPSTKQVRGSQAPSKRRFSVDHFQCYRIRPAGDFDGHGLVLRDQFGAWKTKIGTPSQLCVPVRKNKTRVGDPVEHLVCYRTRPARSLKRRVRVRNQFGVEDTRIGIAGLFCVPSLKVVREL
jgi:hypothetical protein